MLTVLTSALSLLAVGVLPSALAPKDTAHAAETKAVAVWYLRPSDVPADQRYADGIAKVMAEAQRFYKQELGKTFRLDSPVVHVVEGQQPKSWYETNGGGDPYFRAVNNMRTELEARFHPDPTTVNVGLISAENPGAGGGGGGGWVVLSGHDADGAAGTDADGEAGIERWYGGMIHELGHAFGLPDSPSDDTTPMSGTGVYAYGPNIHFTQAQKDGILGGGYASILS